MRIQHNIMAMGAYRNYTNNLSAMKKNLEKLSSGYKINRAGDDAAGLAISEKMRAQITGLETAQKNAKDGISLVQTAEGALTEVHDMLNRMVELATQSANGTYDNDTDRYQLQKELDQLRSEINRIADSSNFNGIKLLDGDMDGSVSAIGEKDLIASTSQILKDGQMGRDGQIGVFSVNFSNTILSNNTNADITGVKFNIFGKDIELDDIGVGKQVTGEQLAEKIAAQWNANCREDTDLFGGVKMTASYEGSKVTFTMDDLPSAAWTGDAKTGKFTAAGAWQNQAEEVTVTMEKEPVDATKKRMYAQASFTLAAADANGKIGISDGKTLKIGDTTYVFAVGAKSKFKDAENVVDLTDIEQSSVKDRLGVIGMRLSQAAADNKNFKVGTTTADGVITITEKEGGVDYSVNNLAGKDGIGGEKDDATSGVANKLATVADWAGLVKVGTADTSRLSKGLTLQIGDTAEKFNQLKVSIKDCHTDALGLDNISIADQSSAQTAVDAIKKAINYVSDVRGTLGATQNRLDHTINNLSVMTENIQDAESTIRDTDVAEEMMAYTKNNILIQSAQAMLAQANQVPQGVLQLLQ